MSVSRNIKDGKYENKMDYPVKPKQDDFKFKQDGNLIFLEADYEQALKNFTTLVRAYRVEEGQLIDLFKSDALEELGLSDHPKADRFFNLCWEESYSSGLNEVWLTMEDWSDLLT